MAASELAVESVFVMLSWFAPGFPLMLMTGVEMDAAANIGSDIVTMLAERFPISVDLEGTHHLCREARICSAQGKARHRAWLGCC